jgi:Holliday junction resolvase
MEIKLIKTNKNGIPDIVAIPKYSRALFVEVKTETGKVSPLQEYRINELKEHGIKVEVYRGTPMDQNKRNETNRAERIFFNMDECQEMLTNIYENLVDRDFEFASEEIRNVILELRLILKSIPDDDF